MKTIWLGLALAAALAVGVVACGGSSSAKKVTLGNLTATDKGTKDITNQTAISMEVDSYYFEPTFLKGTAGQKVKVTVTNDSTTLHNFSVPGQAIDTDVAAKGKVDIDVTLPASGALLFLCKYHSGQGMNGELLVGDATPQAASAAVVQPSLKITTNPTLGAILTDPSGKTLYTFKNDVANSGKSAASATTIVNWPVFGVTSGDPVKPAALTGALVVITRDDGTKQVTYNGLPLYYYAKDVNPGDTNGQGVANVWFVATP